MAIRRLKVSNFRSFNELDVELGDFNVLIGANASGKSNFVEVFRFLRDIRKEGLRNAVALQGGSRYVQNLRIGTTEPLSIDITDLQDVAYVVISTHEEETRHFVRVNEMSYGFSLDSPAKGHGPHADNWSIQRDSIARGFSVYPNRARDDNSANAEKLIGTLEFSAWREKDVLKRAYRGDSSLIELLNQKEDVGHFDSDLFPKDSLLLESRLFTYLLTGKLGPPFSTIRDPGIFRTDARASRQTQTVRASAALTESASNLAPVLDRILSDGSSRKTFLNLVRYLLPFINDIGVENLTDESSLLYVKEAFTDETQLYAGMMSEGTIAAIALVVALYFEENSLLIFEDPDRGMHPKLMSRVVEMMKEVSKDKQIIVTTHHPEMVRYAGVENLLLVSRDENGFSQITRPADKTMVKRFLENDIGIDELYVDDLLEV